MPPGDTSTKFRPDSPTPKTRSGASARVGSWPRRQGYRAGELRYLTRIFTTPGFTDEVIHIFGAAALEGGMSDHDHDEFIEVVAMLLSEAVELVRTGVGSWTARALPRSSSPTVFRARAWAEARPGPFPEALSGGCVRIGTRSVPLRGHRWVQFARRPCQIGNSCAGTDPA
jgi:hypothetical protein